MESNRGTMEARLDKAQTKIKPQHCADCGGLKAHVPMACVMNMTTAAVDTYKLQLPPLCNNCCEKRGITRRGILAPKTREIQNTTEILTELMEKIPNWSKRVLQKQYEEFVAQGMPEQEVKDFLGIK